MVIDKKKHSDKPRLNQGSSAGMAEPNKIASCTHFDFQGKNLTPYGGLFPVATMLERLGFEKLVSEILKVKRIPRVMTIYQFILGMVLAIYVGFARLNHLRFVAQDPMLTGILNVSKLPGQSVFWRFLASLNLNLSDQLLQLQRILRERVATARLRFLFVAAKIWKHSGRVGISYSDQYAESGLFERLMKRLREITNGPAGFLPVLATALSG